MSGRHVVLFRTALEAWDATEHEPHHDLAHDQTAAASPATRTRPRARVLRGASLPRSSEASWGLPQFSSRLSELSGVGAAARLSLAFALVRDAQQRREPVAWVGIAGSSFYPPDAATGGVDLAALPVITAPDAAAAARAATHLARSGAFGLLVIDLAPAPATTSARFARAVSVPPPLLTKLAGLAQQYGTAMVFLTASLPEQPSLGSLISLRCEAKRQDAGDGRFLCVAHALKDKRRGPGWSYAEVQLGPLGLR